MVAHIINFRESRGRQSSESEISLVYTGSSRTDRAIQRYFASKKKKKIFRLMAMQSVRRKTSLWALKGTLVFQY